MGCWNKTCGLSRVHISCGEKVFVVPIFENTHHDRCYSHALWSPANVGFWSTYNDYGGGENSTGVFIDQILKHLKFNLVPVEQGPNQYHDIPVNADILDLELFFEAVHENRLKVYSRSGSSKVDFVMIHGSILSHLKENHVFREYVGGSNGTGGTEYLLFGWKDIWENRNHLVGKVKDLVASGLNNNLGDYSINNIPYDAKYLPENITATFFCMYNHFGHTTVAPVFNMLIGAIECEDQKMIDQVLEDRLTLVFVEAIMSMIRGIWVPGCHEGSQTNEPGGYRSLCAAITSVLDDERAGQGDDSED